MTPAWPDGDLRLTPPPGPAEVFQGDGAPLKAEASGENHGPRAAGRRPAGNASDRLAETRRGSDAPLETKAGAGDQGLWAEDRATVGRLLMEAHHSKTVWQDCPANKRLATEYTRNVL